MNLWIRSQDKKTLEKVERLTIDDTYSIFANYDDIFLGSYIAEERALEVLDEIQKFINTPNIIEENILKNQIIHKKKVYEMPEE